MREIKFRAWDNKRNKMYSAEELGSDEMQLNPDGRGFFNAHCNSQSLSEYYPHLIPMQFTGLKDKNGKDIYEGDLIAEINNLSELEKWGDPLTVEFGQFESEADSWGVKSCTIGFFCRYKEGEQTGLHNSEEGYGFNAGDCLVIGNIYEAQSLLKQ